MTLTDQIREHTKPVDEVIRALEAQVDGLRKEKAAAENLRRTAVAEAQGERHTHDERDRAAQKIQADIEGIEEQIEKLTEDLQSRRDELAEQHELIGSIRASITEKRKLEQEANRRVEEFARQIQLVGEEVQRLQQQLVKARGEALRAYLNSVWSGFVEQVTTHELRREQTEARKQLEIARNQDPEIMELWEARAAWRQILSSGAPPLVRATAEAQMKTLETQLEKSFPGALESIEAPISGPEIVELFLLRKRAGDAATVFLPIPLDTWMALEAGDTSAKETLAMNLIWEFSRWVNDRQYEADYRLIEAFPVLDLSGRGLEDLEGGTISLRLPQQTRVDVVLSTLPPELGDALR